MKAKTGGGQQLHSVPETLRHRNVLAKKLGLRLVTADALGIRRRRVGRRFTYYSGSGRKITDERVLRRLASLAVPPAYTDVRLAADARAHLQAIGRDAAGRLQYRYHPDWTLVRETLKANHLAQLLNALPRVRRGLTKHLSGKTLTRQLALAAVIELVAHSSIRAGREVYAREHGTRGAATLLKSDVELSGDRLILNFVAKGGKKMQKEIAVERLTTVVRRLLELPGKRLFQYIDERGTIRTVRAREVNEFLVMLSGVEVSLKDFRTLCACVTTLDAILRVPLAASSTQRGKQLREAVKIAAEQLGNTPTMCRNSYVRTVVEALDDRRALKKLSAVRKMATRPAPEKVLSTLLQAPRALPSPPAALQSAGNV